MVAALNRGLGHARRCVPIIRKLLSNHYKVTIASDGHSLQFLRKEFPLLAWVALPTYNSLIEKRLLPVLKTIRNDHKVLKQLIIDYNIDGVISDSRLGLYSKRIPCVLITHRLHIWGDKVTGLSHYIHHHFLHKFKACWIPDVSGKNNLAGTLTSSLSSLYIPTQYIGALSKVKGMDAIIDYDIVVILSSSDPQREALEQVLLSKLQKFNGNVLLVQGLSTRKTRRTKVKNIEVITSLSASQLEVAIHKSTYVIARPEYALIMDLAVLQKKAFFIPTPGHKEQEHLAQHLKNLRVSPYALQDVFRVKDLSKLKVYTGFNKEYRIDNLASLFCLFEGKRELRTHPKLAFNIHFLLVRFNNMFNDREPQT